MEVKKLIAKGKKGKKAAFMESNVKSYLHRALVTLKMELKEECMDE